jgi:hypothetical protein
MLAPAAVERANRLALFQPKDAQQMLRLLGRQWRRIALLREVGYVEAVHRGPLERYFVPPVFISASTSSTSLGTAALRMYGSPSVISTVSSIRT